MNFFLISAMFVFLSLSANLMADYRYPDQLKEYLKQKIKHFDDKYWEVENIPFYDCDISTRSYELGYYYGVTSAFRDILKYENSLND